MKKIAVLGSGLLGGSIALATQKRLPDTCVALWGRRETAITEASACGIKEATTDLKTAVNGAQIIGSHPMAGSEQTGVGAASEDLFEGAACVMTNDFAHPESDVSLLWSFWESLGCHCHLISSEEHDSVMARISHLPHMIASIGALVGLKTPSNGEFAGNGMRDTTRVASGHAGMWAEILIRNRSALKIPIEETISYLSQMLFMLENNDEEGITHLLQQAKDLRDDLTRQVS